jgi:hypothetical protein
LANASGLIDGALLLNAQMHREVQKRILFACVGRVAFVQSRLLVAQISLIFRVLLNPRRGQGLHAVQGLVEFQFGMDLTEKPSNIVLGGGKHECIFSFSESIRVQNGVLASDLG